MESSGHANAAQDILSGLSDDLRYVTDDQHLEAPEKRLKINQHEKKNKVKQARVE